MGFPPQQKAINFILEFIMKQNVLRGVNIVETEADRTIVGLRRSLKKEKKEREHEKDQREKIHHMYFEATAAIRREKSQEMCKASTFNAGNQDGKYWNGLDSSVKNDYFSTLKKDEYPVLRQSHYSFLPPGIDICVTVRDSTANEHILTVLGQIMKAIQMNKNISQYTEYDYCDEYRVDVINGILI